MRRTARQRWVPAAVTALVTAAATVHAQAPPKPGSAAAAQAKAIAQAEKHYNAGLAAADLKQWQKAAEEYRKAYALSPLPQILGSLGEAELRLGQPRDAAEHLARFLVEDKGAGSDERAAAAALLAEAKKEVVTLKITVNEVGAEVLIDDQVIGVSPLPEETFVTPGKHTVVARKGTARDEVTDTYQKDWTRVMRLKPKEPGAVVPTSTGTGPVVPPTSTSQPAASPFPVRTVALVSGGAVAVIALGVGIVGVALSAGKRGERDGVCTIEDCLKPGAEGYGEQKATWKGLDDERVSLFNMGLPALVVGGIAAAGTGVAFFLWKPSPTRPESKTGIRLIPAGPGVVLKADW